MYEGAIQDLIDELGRLPGIGPKSAQRLAFHVLLGRPGRRQPAGRGAAAGSRSRCGSAPPASTWPSPSSAGSAATPRRTDEVLCVVEEPKDVVAIERTGEFRGRYHVLGGAINPLEGIGPDNLRIRELMARLGARRGQGADPRHRPEHRGRGDRDLPGADGQADGHRGHPAGQRAAGRRRPGVRRRDHPGPRLRGAPRGLSRARSEARAVEVRRSTRVVGARRTVLSLCPAMSGATAFPGRGVARSTRAVTEPTVDVTNPYR